MTQSPPSSPASPKLSLGGASLIGIASMLGAGVFVVFAPAALLSGSYLLVAIALAGLVAALNARSMRQLSKVLPRAGGAYAYGREYLSKSWGFLAGISFVLGKIGSVAAIALAAAAYIYPAAKVEVAIGAVLLMTVINLLGINRTALGALILSVPTILLLLLVGFFGLQQDTGSIQTELSITGIISAAALIFFAFAGYARVATLGEEVRNPAVNVPRAITIGLVSVLSLYLLVGNALSRTLGPSLERSVAPVLDFTNTVMPWLAGEVVIVIAGAACLGSLLSLLAGISRTAEAMARDGELPRVLTRRSQRFDSPWAAEIVIAAVAISLISSGDIVWTIGISSFCVLGYYAIANLAAIRQLGGGQWNPKFLALLGLATCCLLAAFVPLGSLLLGIALLALALVTRAGLIKLRPSS
jgi:basic amino acid/polyamine antiporter, APA family